MILPYPIDRYPAVQEPAQNFEHLLFEKMENLEMEVEKIKIVFSLQNLLKVLPNAVILSYHSLESVHGARRTVHLKFENWQCMDLLELSLLW